MEVEIRIVGRTAVKEAGWLKKQIEPGPYKLRLQTPMNPPPVCHKCQKKFSTLRIGLHWPTKIVCSSCGSAHYYRFGHIIGIIYLLLSLPCLALPLTYSGKFANVKDGIYTSSLMSYVAHIGGVIVVVLVGGFIFGTIMKNFSTLRTKNS